MKDGNEPAWGSDGLPKRECGVLSAKTDVALYGLDSRPDPLFPRGKPVCTILFDTTLQYDPFDRVVVISSRRVFEALAQDVRFKDRESFPFSLLRLLLMCVCNRECLFHGPCCISRHGFRFHCWKVGWRMQATLQHQGPLAHCATESGSLFTKLYASAVWGAYTYLFCTYYYIMSERYHPY